MKDCCPTTHTHTYIYKTSLVGKVFTNGLGDWGSIPGRDIPKTHKWYLMPPCLALSIIRYGSRVSGAVQGKE